MTISAEWVVFVLVGGELALILRRLGRLEALIRELRPHGVVPYKLDEGPPLRGPEPPLAEVFTPAGLPAVMRPPQTAAPTTGSVDFSSHPPSSIADAPTVQEPVDVQQTVEPHLPTGPRLQDPGLAVERRDQNERDTVQLTVTNTEGTLVRRVVVGSLEGRWIDRKLFLVREIQIQGPLTRDDLLSLGGRLEVRRELERALHARRNDNPIMLDFACNVGRRAGVTVATPIVGAVQDFSVALIPRIELARESLQIEVNEQVRPLRIFVRATGKEQQ